MIYAATLLLGVGVSLISVASASDTAGFWEKATVDGIGTALIWGALSLVLREARK